MQNLRTLVGFIDRGVGDSCLVAAVGIAMAEVE